MSARSSLTSRKVSLEFCAQTSSARCSSARTTPESNPRGCMVRRLKAKNNKSSHNKSKSCLHLLANSTLSPCPLCCNKSEKADSDHLPRNFSKPAATSPFLLLHVTWQQFLRQTDIRRQDGTMSHFNTHAVTKILQITAPRSPTTEQENLGGQLLRYC